MSRTRGSSAWQHTPETNGTRGFTLKRAIRIGAFGLIAASQIAHAVTFYVSQDSGDDRNSGLGWDRAWRSLEAAGQRAGAGDIVIIRKSVAAYRFLGVVNSGTENQPIIFRGEDPNDPPLISGAERAESWERSSTAGVWEQAPEPMRPGLLDKVARVIVDGLALRPASSAACLDGAWFFEAGILYYRPESGTPSEHVIWKLVLGSGITFHRNNAWVVVEHVRCWMVPGPCVSIRESQHISIRHIRAEWGWRGVDIYQNANFNSVEFSQFYDNQEAVYIHHQSSYNRISDCVAERNGTLPIWTTGDRHAIAIGEGGPNIGNVVEGCTIVRNGAPPDNVALIAFRAPDSVFRDNVVAENFGSGIFITIDSHGSVVEQNHVHDNGRAAVDAGIRGIAGVSVRNSNHVTVQNNRIENNYVSPDSIYENYYTGPHGGLDVDGASKADMSNILLKDNVVHGTIGGPNFTISSRPLLEGLTIVNTPMEPPSTPGGVNVRQTR